LAVDCDSNLPHCLGLDKKPGHVWLQSLPLSRLANRIIAAAPRTGGRKEEGSILGGLGNLLDGSE